MSFGSVFSEGTPFCGLKGETKIGTPQFVGVPQNERHTHVRALCQVQIFALALPSLAHSSREVLLYRPTTGESASDLEGDPSSTLAD